MMCVYMYVCVCSPLSILIWEVVRAVHTYYCINIHTYMLAYSPLSHMWVCSEENRREEEKEGLLSFQERPTFICMRLLIIYFKKNSAYIHTYIPSFNKDINFFGTS